MEDMIYNRLDDDAIADLLEQAEEDNEYMQDQWEDAAYLLDKTFDKYGVHLYDILNTPVVVSYSELEKGLGATRLLSDEDKRKYGTDLIVLFSPALCDEEVTNIKTVVNAIIHEMCHVAAYQIDHKLSHEGTWQKIVDDLNKEHPNLDLKQFCDDI